MESKDIKMIEFSVISFIEKLTYNVSGMFPSNTKEHYKWWDCNRLVYHYKNTVEYRINRKEGTFED